MIKYPKLFNIPLTGVIIWLFQELSIFLANGNIIHPLITMIISFYICSSATGRLVHAKDHASVQIHVGEVDENGHYINRTKDYVMSGFVRNNGEGNDSLDRLCMEDGIIKGK